MFNRKSLIFSVFSFVLATTIMASIVDTDMLEAKSVSEYKGTQQNIESQLSKIEKQKKATQGELSKNKEYVASLDKIMDSTTAEYREMQAILNDLRREEQQLEEDIKQSEKEYKQKVRTLKKRVKAVYQNSSYSYIYTLLNSESILDFNYRTEMIAKIVENDNKILAEVEAAKKDLELKRRLKAEKAAEAKAQTEKLQTEINNLSEKHRAAAMQVQQAQASLASLEKRETELEEEAKRIDQMIANLLAQSSGSSSSHGNYSGGSMCFPLASAKIVTSTFGYRIHPIFKTKRYHSGVDLAASMGTTIYAAESGTVIFAGWQNGYGNTTIISHGNNITTLYAHQSSISVKVNQKVKRGQKIGAVGSTGWSTGPHLHFEVRKGSTKLNPLGGYI